MASIYLLNKLCASLPSNAFIQADTTASIVIGGISKFAVEHTLLKYEANIYTTLIMSSSMFASKVNAPLITLPLLMTLPVICCIPYFVPAYRTYNAIVNKNIKCINFTSINQHD